MSVESENHLNGTANSEMEKLSIVYIKEFQTRTKSDSTEPWIGGLVCLADGKTVVLDMENQKLKLFDDEFAFISELKMEHKGAGITVTSDEELAVTCGNEIHFFVVNGNSINQSKKVFRLHGIGYGITSEGGEYGVTLGTTSGPKSLELLDENGRAQWAITEKNEVGTDLDIPKHLAIDKEKRLYIANCSDNVVQCISYNKESQTHLLLWEASVPGGPKGICTFKNSVLTACFYGRKVYQISSKGDVINEISIDKENIEHPEIIVYQQTTNKILISCYDEDKIWVFDVK